MNRFEELAAADLSAEEQDEVVNLALDVMKRRNAVGDGLTSPDAVRKMLQLRIGERHNELFGCVWLDNRHRLIGDEELFFGTIDGASVHARVVVQRALAKNAAAVIFYHNHPSGVAEPSRADQAITRRLRDVLSVIDVRVVDHLVISHSEVVSLAEKGLM